jgi:hypothetical protein
MATAAFLDVLTGKLGTGHLNNLGQIMGGAGVPAAGVADGWEGRAGEARWPFAPPLPRTFAEQRLQEDLSAWRDMYASKRAR